MRIEIVNWNKFNPRTDVKHTTWFRLENTFWMSLFSFDNDQKMVWIMVLALASTKMSASIDLDIDMIAANLKLSNEAVLSTLKALQDKEMIEIPTSRGRNADVTRTSRGRNADRHVDVPPPTNERTNERTNREPTTEDKKIWPDSDPMAVVFENLKGFPAYWRVFDREKDRGVIVEHMDHHKLSLADMEQVTRELRLWVDGSSEVVKSPRGKLATFVKNHALRKPKDNGQRRISLLETYGLAVPSDGV